MINDGIQTYRRTTVTTAEPGKLVLMCYDGAINQLKIAVKMYQENKFEKKYKAVAKAEDIIDELRCSLDFEKGGKIARNLESLYNYMTRKIVQSDVNKDIDGLNEVINMLEELKSAWEIVVNNQRTHLQPGSLGGESHEPQQSIDRMSA